MLIKSFFTFCSTIFSCLYFLVNYNTYAKQLTSIESERSNWNINKLQDCTHSSMDENNMKINPMTFYDQNQHMVNENDITTTQYMFSRDIVKEEAIQVTKSRWYTSISGGTVYSSNSEIFIDGIQAIGNRALKATESSSFGAFAKKLLIGELDDIARLKGAIDFKWSGNTSIGCFFGKNGRVDVEAMFSQIEINSDVTGFDRSASISSFLFNLYYNPSIKNTKIAPYFGLGIGPTVFRFKKIDKRSQESIPLNIPWGAYQIKFGADYAISQAVKMFLGYRYFNIPAPVTGIVTHSIEMGVQVTF